MPLEKLIFDPLPSRSNENLFRLQGPLTLNNLFSFQQVLRQQSATTILDMSGVPYLDSAGLGVLVNSHVSHQQRGHLLILVGVNDRVQELLKLTKVDSVLGVVPDLGSAYRVLDMRPQGIS